MGACSGTAFLSHWWQKSLQMPPQWQAVQIFGPPRWEANSDLDQALQFPQQSTEVINSVSKYSMWLQDAVEAFEGACTACEMAIKLLYDKVMRHRLPEDWAGAEWWVQVRNHPPCQPRCTKIFGVDTFLTSGCPCCVARQPSAELEVTGRAGSFTLSGDFEGALAAGEPK